MRQDFENSNLESKPEMGSSNLVDVGAVSENNHSHHEIRPLKELCKDVIVAQSLHSPSSNIDQDLGKICHLRDVKSCTFPGTRSSSVLVDKLEMGQQHSSYHGINGSIIKTEHTGESKIKEEIVEDESNKDDVKTKIMLHKDSFPRGLIKKESLVLDGLPDTPVESIDCRQQINLCTNNGPETSVDVKNNCSSVNNCNNVMASLGRKCIEIPHNLHGCGSYTNFDKNFCNNLKLEDKEANYEHYKQLKYKLYGRYTNPENLQNNYTQSFSALPHEQNKDIHFETQECNADNELATKGKFCRAGNTSCTGTEVNLPKRKWECSLREGTMDCSGAEEGMMLRLPSSSQQSSLRVRDLRKRKSFGMGSERLSFPDTSGPVSAINTPYFPLLGSSPSNTNNSVRFPKENHHHMLFGHPHSSLCLSSCNDVKFESCRKPAEMPSDTVLSGNYGHLEEDTSSFIMDCTTSCSSNGSSVFTTKYEGVSIAESSSDSYLNICEKSKAKSPHFGSNHYAPCNCEECCAPYLSSSGSPFLHQHVLPEYEKLPRYCRQFETRRTEGLKSQEEELLRRIEVSLAETETLKSQEEELLKRIEKSLTETESLKCREEELLKKIERSLTEAECLKSREEELLRRIEVSLAQTETVKCTDEELLLRIEASLADAKYSISKAADTLDDMEFEVKYKPDTDFALPLKKRKKRLKTLTCNEEKDFEANKIIFQPESFPSYPVRPMISIAELEAQGHIVPTLSEGSHLTFAPSVAANTVSPYYDYDRFTDDSLYSRNTNAERTDLHKNMKVVDDVYPLTKVKGFSGNQSCEEKYNTSLVHQPIDKDSVQFCENSCRIFHSTVKRTEQSLQNEVQKNCQYRVPECSNTIRDSSTNINLISDNEGEESGLRNEKFDSRMNINSFVSTPEVMLRNSCVKNVFENDNLHKCNISKEFGSTTVSSKENLNPHGNIRSPSHLIDLSSIKVETDSTSRNDSGCNGSVMPLGGTSALSANVGVIESDTKQGIIFQEIPESTSNSTNSIKIELDSKDKLNNRI